MKVRKLSGDRGPLVPRKYLHLFLQHYTTELVEHVLTIDAFFDEIENYMGIQLQSQDATKENQHQIPHRHVVED